MSRVWIVFGCWILAVVTTSGSISAQEQSTAALSRKILKEAEVKRWKLPTKLREISALALDATGNLFALTDEHATLYQLDYTKGRIIKTISPGSIRGDFEGLAIAGDRFFLITSDGKLTVVSKDANGGLSTRSLDTGLGQSCEIEALTYQATHNALLIGCKQPRSESLRNSVSLFRWSLSEERLLPHSSITLPEGLFTERLESNSFQPSAVAIDPRTNHIILLASRQEQAMAELSATGQLLKVFRLPGKKHHRQPEGLAITASGEVILADEGGKGKARLTVYTLKRSNKETHD